MRIHLEWLPEGARSAAKREDVIVVVDTLRSAALIVTALANGVEKVFIANDISDAVKLKSIYGDMIIAGEVGELPLNKYNVGNSPTKLMKALNESPVKYVSIIAEATSGTRTVNAIFTENPQANVFVGSTLNASHIAKTTEKYADNLSKDVTIVCSGYLGKEFALEDFMTAGLIAKRMKNASYDDNVVAAIMIGEIFENDPEKYLTFQEKSRSYVRLKSIKAEEDIEFCLRQDEYKISPYGKYEGSHRGTPIIYFEEY